MQTIVLNGQVPTSLRGGCVALGNFDGLHAGHRAVIDGARTMAKDEAPVVVATFDPTPRDLFAPDGEPSRIHTALQRQRGLQRLNVDGCVLMPFDRELSQLSDTEFVERILVKGAGAAGVSVGFDFRFGRGRMGDAKRLVELGHEYGFEVTIVEEVADGFGKLSSTRIRDAIVKGELAEAARILGDWWTIDSVVEDGEKRGRTLGYPTANLRMGKLVPPPFGVYAVWCREAGSQDWVASVASFGRTPTTGLRDPLLEVHLIDFEGDLYGKRLEVAFVAFLRPEAHFGSIDELVAQMDLDKAQAVDALADAALPL